MRLRSGVTLFFTWLGLTLGQCVASDTLDLSFDAGSGMNGQVMTVAQQPDGKTIIGGLFTTVRGGFHPYLARLETDGAIDSSFDASNRLYGGVSAVALQTDGKLLVTGYAIPGADSLRRLNADGSLDGSFRLDLAYSGVVNAIAIQPDGKIVIGGSFTIVGDTPRARIARLNSDGTLDLKFDTGSGADMDVNTLLVQPDGKILLAGAFVKVNGATRSHLARLNPDGSLDGQFPPGLSYTQGSIAALALQPDGKIIVGGAFNRIGNQAGGPIVRLNGDGSQDSSFGLALQINGYIHALAVQPDGKIVMAGDFYKINGTALNNIARLNADGSLDDTFTSPRTAEGLDFFPSVTSVILQNDGRLLVASSPFSGAALGRGINRLEADGSLDETFAGSSAADGVISRLAVRTDGNVIVAGEFTAIGGQGHGNVARITASGSRDLSFDAGTGAHGLVNQIVALDDGKTLIAGGFDTFDGQVRNGLARLNPNGTLDEAFLPAFTSTSAVNAIAVQKDGKLLAAGWLNLGVSGNTVVRFNQDGSVDDSFKRPVVEFDPITAIAVQADGKVVIAGKFLVVNGATRHGLARLMTNGLLDESFDLNLSTSTDVRAIVLQPDGKLLAGGYLSYPFKDSFRSGIIRVNSDGHVDASFDPESAGVSYPNRLVLSLALQPDGKVLLAGSFTGLSQGITTHYLARLNQDGSLDLTLHPEIGPDNEIQCIAAHPDGGVMISGPFTAFDHVARAYIAKLSAASPQLEARRSSMGIILNWFGATDILQSAPTLTDTYQPVVGATSPYTNRFEGGQRFFRLGR